MSRGGLVRKIINFAKSFAIVLDFVVNWWLQDEQSCRAGLADMPPHLVLPALA